MPFRLFNNYRRFGKSQLLKLQNQPVKEKRLSLKMKALQALETSVTTYQMTRRKLGILVPAAWSLWELPSVNTVDQNVYIAGNTNPWKLF